MKPLGTAELDEALVRHPEQQVIYRDPQAAIMPAGVRIAPACHPMADFKIVYERPGGYLVLACSACSMIRARVAVARL